LPDKEDRIVLRRIREMRATVEGIRALAESAAAPGQQLEAR
jgi:hypothetical protein